MDENTLIIKALNKLVFSKTEKGAYGLLITGIPTLPIKQLLDSYMDYNDIYISFVGVKENQEMLMEWVEKKGWDSNKLGFNATHAVSVRNEAPDDSIKLAFVWEDEDRLHSLIERGYQYIGPIEIIEQIGIMGSQNAGNLPQQNLWKALSSEEITPYIALDGITRYYLEWYNVDVASKDINKPRENLIFLNLLPDKELLAKKYIEVEQIIKRLIQNAKMVERIQRADEEDRQIALKTLKQNAEDLEIKDQLKRDYNAYLHLTRSDYSMLNQLELERAIFLLSGKQKLGNIPYKGTSEDNDDGQLSTIDVFNGDEDEEFEEDISSGESDESDEKDDESDEFQPGDEDKKGRGNYKRDLVVYDNLTEAAIRLVSLGSDRALELLVKEALSQLSSRIIEKKVFSVNHERLIIQAHFNPNEIAISVNRNFTQKSTLGGEINAEEDEYAVVLGNLGQFLDRAKYYDEVRVKTLLELMKRVETIVEGFEGKDLMASFLTIREKLIQYSEMLSVEPLACLLANLEVKKIVVEYIEKYEVLLDHLDNYYAHIHKESPEGVIRIYKEILSLDTIKIVSKEDVSVILSAINPLVLWKYLEISNLIVNKDGALALNDVDLLIEEINNLPEPLLAIYSPFKNEIYEKLGYSSRIGSLPIYRSTSVEMSDLSQKSIGTASVKLASLYPPVKENVRVLLIDPVSTSEFSKTLRTLIEKHSFKKATLIMVKVGKSLNNNDFPFDPILKDLVFENKVSIEILKVANIDRLHDYLKDKPVHIMGISGEKTKNVKLIETEGTKLHPLSVPHKLHVDPLIGTVTLKPRSLKSNENGVKHPFNVYHKVVSELTGNHKVEFSMEEASRTSIKDVNSLLQYSQFVITLGQVSEISENPQLIRLTQNVEQSGDTIYTYYKDSIISRLSSHLQKFNYQPTQDGLMTLLNRLQAVGGEGVFSTITEKGVNGFSESGVKGLLGLAVALNWYMNDSADENNIVISLDSYLARKWLNKRENKKRSDFLGIRQLPDGSYSIDVLEVKGYEATNENDVLDSHASEQLQSVSQVITAMVKQQGDLFTDRRRELLRLQIFRESLQLNSKHDPKWIKTLNSIIDGEQEVKINLILLEVAFDQNIDVKEQLFTNENKELNGTLPIKRIRFGEKDIQKYLEDYVEKIPEISKGEKTVNSTLALKEITKNEEVENAISVRTNAVVNVVDEKKSLSFNSEKLNLESDVYKNTGVIDESENKKNDIGINSEVSLLLGNLAVGKKLIYWDHRRSIENPLVNHNIIITGDPGKGKTQTIKGLMHELRSNNIPLLTFDFKDDYIDDEFLEEERIQKFDIMLEGLPFNPLVPSIDPIEKKFTAISHIVQIESILKRVYGLGPQQASILRNAIREAFIRKGIQPNRPTSEKEVNEFPNFQDVFKILQADEKKNASLIGRLDLLFQIGIFPDVPSISFDDLMEGSYVLRLSTLPDPDNEIKAAVAEIIVLAVHNYLISKKHPRKLTRAIVLDEAHRVSHSKALLNLMREGRAFGLGMLIATQFPTDIPQDIYGCTETKLFLGNDGVEHAEAAAKKLEGGTSKHNINLLADQIRSMKQFQAVLRNAHYNNIFVDIKPYFQRK